MAWLFHSAHLSGGARTARYWPRARARRLIHAVIFIVHVSSCPSPICPRISALTYTRSPFLS